MNKYPKTGEYRKARKATFEYQLERLARNFRKFLEAIVDELNEFLKTKYGKLIAYAVCAFIVLLMALDTIAT